MSNLSGGARQTSRRSRRSRSKDYRKQVNRSQERRSRSKKPVKRPALPKTARLLSKRSKSIERMQMSRANSSMSLTDLQFMAKSRGIPFGALTKTKLIRKINNYGVY